MAKAQGRIFLKTDGGAKDLDRLVEREAVVTFYPTSTQSDAPAEVQFLYHEGKITVKVLQRLPNGSGVHHAEIVLDNKNPER